MNSPPPGPYAAPALARNTILGLLASVALAIGKLLAGLIGHSTALIADALESFADTIGSIVVWRALQVADKPPDAAHPYGYGKAEAVAALIVGGLLLLAAGFIVVHSFEELLTPHRAPAAWTLWVLVAVILVKEALFRLVLRGAELGDSDAARADAWHHRSDAVTSAAALIGVSVAIFGPRWFDAPRLVLADEIAAIAASGVIALTATRLVRPALHELLDAAAPALAAAVRQTAADIPGVRLVEKIHARKSGRGYLVDMHLHVDPDLSVRVSHSLAGQVRAAIRRQHASVRDVLIHIEPAEPV
ncbi:MAG: cation diffusion facilitator family transporter [Phycisphaerales bacterium]